MIVNRHEGGDHQGGPSTTVTIHTHVSPGDLRQTLTLASTSAPSDGSQVGERRILDLNVRRVVSVDGGGVASMFFLAESVEEGRRGILDACGLPCCIYS